MRYVLIGLIAFVSLILVIAEMKRNQIVVEEIDHAALYAQLIDEMLEHGQEYMTLFNTRELDLLHTHFSEAMKRLMPLPELEAFYNRTTTELGVEASVVSEQLNPQGDHYVYDRIALFAIYGDPVQIKITLNEAHEIIGFQIQPYNEID